LKALQNQLKRPVKTMKAAAAFICSSGMGDGKDWKKVSGAIAPMTDIVRPLLEEAAAKYIADKPGWETQTCK